MFGDTVGRTGYLGAGREIFYGVAAALALLCAHRDHERYFQFVRLAYLITYTFAGKIERDRHIFTPQVLRELYRVTCRFLFHDGDHEFCRGSIGRKEAMHFQKISSCHVAHCEADCRYFLLSEKAKYIVESSATEHRVAFRLVLIA